ncbi:MAG TPA: recombinase family protein [Ktedonobacteraceae bacterium]|jgi:DNA invertase Pin-like site-specific DNA recombinase
MLVGYARVSTQDQTLDLQWDALTRAGCDKIFSDIASGAKGDRPGLAEAMSHLRPGDTLIVWRLDRLGRTLKHLIANVTELQELGIDFKSLQESIDTTTPGGKLIFHVFGALAEFEREVILERTHAGLRAARARGRTGGQRSIESRDPKKIALARKLYAAQEMTGQEICDMLHISRSTLYRYVRHNLRPVA